MLRPERGVRADDGFRRGWYFTTLIFSISVGSMTDAPVEGVKGWWIGKRRRRRWHQTSKCFAIGRSIDGWTDGCVCACGELVLVLFHFRYQYLYWLLLGSATNPLDDALALEIKPRVRLVQLFLDGRVLGHLGAVIHEVTSERE